jgi:hypothetical protein
MYFWVKRNEFSSWEIARRTGDDSWRLLEGLSGEVKIIGPWIYPPRGDQPVIETEPVIDVMAKVAADIDERQDITGEAYMPAEVQSMPIDRKPNDCGVITIMLVLNIPYEKARVIAMHHGWTQSGGIPFGSTELAIQNNGMFTRPVDSFLGRTISSARPPLQKGRTYILETNGRIMAAIDGNVLNVQGSEGREIQGALEVVKHETVK